MELNGSPLILIRFALPSKSAYSYFDGPETTTAKCTVKMVEKGQMTTPEVYGHVW
jgi:hypothetical protein